MKFNFEGTNGTLDSKYRRPEKNNTFFWDLKKLIVITVSWKGKWLLFDWNKFGFSLFYLGTNKQNYQIAGTEMFC